jgi:hypothetical protein
MTCLKAIPCPDCTDGTITETYLINDGIPGVNAEVVSEEKECPFCSGTGTVTQGQLSPCPTHEQIVAANAYYYQSIAG